ncbi:MAG: DUF3318 domain-containing protein [Leptolyngbyaceae cyanobacterium bins.59]|nr:DUF3318 domain-containing protein [Leptolyngbyaceae cyanobacterium bins.59]
MNLDLEIRELLEVMPASGRMLAKVVSRSDLRRVIEVPFPKPWQQERPIYINFQFWGELTRPQRDITILRAVSWQAAIRWFKPDLYQWMTLGGVGGAFVELVQQDIVGVVVAGGLTAIAATQIIRANRSSELEIEADTAALQVAQRRGYTEADAARHLLSAIEAIARIEGRNGLSFIELLRCQNLRSIAGLSATGIPKSFRS